MVFATWTIDRERETLSTIAQLTFTRATKTNSLFATHNTTNNQSKWPSKVTEWMKHDFCINVITSVKFRGRKTEIVREKEQETEEKPNRDIRWMKTIMTEKCRNVGVRTISET